MNQESLRITAFDDSMWAGWPATEYGSTGLACRRLRSGQRRTLQLPLSANRESLAVLSLAAAPSGKPARDWRVLLGGKPVAIHHRKTFPKHLLLELPEVTSSDRAELVFESTGAARPEYDLLIEEIAVMPRAGRFSELWTSPLRALKKLARKRSLPWAPADFPYSHFDGLGYLLDHDEVRQAVLSRKYDTAFHYWYSKGRHEGHPLPLAVEREPLPGTPFNLVMHYKGEYENGSHSSLRTLANAGAGASELTTLQEENDLLLLQLHQVQEELERAFLETKETREAMTKLSSERDNALSERDKLLTELGAAKKSAAEKTMQISQLREAMTKLSSERDNALSERDKLLTELGAAKKSAAEKTMQISQLESRITDQAERQTLIDDQLVKAEGQLELLKDLLRPALQ